MPIEAWDRASIFRLIHESERILYPVALETGAYYYPQGAYQVFESPDGARVGIWAQDMDDLVIEDQIVDEALAGTFKYDENNNRVPVAVGDRLPGRIKDLGNGNIDRLRIFTVKPAYQAEKWLHDEMNKHQAAYRSFVLEQGMLVRESPHRWTSGGIVYRFQDSGVPNRGFFSTFAHAQGIKPRIGDGAYCDDDGTPCSDLIMTAAPGYGWRLGHDYERQYNTDLGGTFMRAASLRAKNVTLEQAAALVQSDFEKRAPKFIEGVDPYTLRNIDGFDEPERRNGFIARYMNKRAITKDLHDQWRARPIRKAVLYFMYGFRQIDWKEMGTSAAIVAVSALVLGAVVHYFGSPLNPAVLAGRVTGKTLNKASQRINEYTRLREMQLNESGTIPIYSYYGKGWNRRQIWGTKPDPAKLHLLRALGHAELNTDLNFCSPMQKTLPDDLTVKEYIFGVLQGPPGSRITPFYFGRYGGVRVDEPNGLSVEHIPDRDTCFARLDWSKLDKHRLPDSVVEMFKSLPADHPYVKISYNPKAGGLTLRSMSAEDYGANVQRISVAEYPPAHRRPNPSDIRLVPPEMPVVPSGFLSSFTRKASGETAGDATEDGAEKLGEVLKSLQPRF